MSSYQKLKAENEMLMNDIYYLVMTKGIAHYTTLLKYTVQFQAENAIMAGNPTSIEQEINPK